MRGDGLENPRRWWIWPLKIAVSLLVLWLVLRRADIRSAWPLLLASSWSWMCLCLALQMFAAYLNAVRWRVLWNERDLPLRKYLYFVFLGYFFNFFLPSAAMSETIRVVAFGHKYRAMQANIGVNLLGKAVGIAIQFVLAGLGLIILGPTIWENWQAGELGLHAGFIALLASGIMLGAVFLFAFRKRIAGMPWVAVIWQSARNGKILSRVFWLSLGIQIAVILVTKSLFAGAQVPVAWWHLLLFIPLIQVALLLPVTVGGIGLREYLNVALFSGVAGIPADAVLAVTLLGYIPMFAMAGVGGAWMFGRKFLLGREPA